MKYAFLIIFFIAFSCTAREEILPSPLFSIGHNIVPAKTFENDNYLYYSDGPGNHCTTLSPRLIYGFTDQFSVTFITPITHEKDEFVDDIELSNLTIQPEWAFIQKRTEKSVIQFTALASLQFRNGNSSELSSIPTSLVVGTTGVYSGHDWYIYYTYLVRIPSHNGSRRFGTNFFYEGGIGMLPFRTEDFYFAAVIEWNGVFIEKERVDEVRDPNTGSNTLVLGPVFDIGYKDVIFQIGFQYPVTQQLHGDQSKIDFIMGYGLSLVFHF